MRTMNLYLAGAIERSPDGGVGIREAVIEAFKDTDEVCLINPCDFQYNKGTKSMWDYQHDKSHTFYECFSHAEKIGRGDVEAVLECDAILVLLDDKCGAGTASECTLARYEGKPVLGLFLDPNRWRDVHPWIIGKVSAFFNSVEELKAYVLSLCRR